MRLTCFSLTRLRIEANQVHQPQVSATVILLHIQLLSCTDTAVMEEKEFSMISRPLKMFYT